MIAYPFRLLQCCLVTDGGGALILVAGERAKDSPQQPVYLLGTGESVETPMVSPNRHSCGSRNPGPKVPATALGPRFRGGDEKVIPIARVSRRWRHRLCRGTTAGQLRSDQPRNCHNRMVLSRKSEPTIGRTVCF